jgi:hypothetical protein
MRIAYDRRRSLLAKHHEAFPLSGACQANIEAHNSNAQSNP